MHIEMGQAIALGCLMTRKIPGFIWLDGRNYGSLSESGRMEYCVEIAVFFFSSFHLSLYPLRCAQCLALPYLTVDVIMDVKKPFAWLEFISRQWILSRVRP